jgi:hypothetical protein
MEPNKDNILLWVEGLESGEFPQGQVPMGIDRMNMARWIGGLRSGRYQQTIGTLKYQQPTEDLRTRVPAPAQCCCPGVACEEALRAGVVMELALTPAGFVIYDSIQAHLPRKVQEWLGLEEYDYDPRLLENLRCIEANDKANWTFGMVADALQERYLGGQDGPELTLIRQHIPLRLGEAAHQWQPTDLQGCETCGSHTGFMCTNPVCHACVDSALEPKLADAVTFAHILAGGSDEDHT